MPPNAINTIKPESSTIDYKDIGDHKAILKYIFVRRIQLAVLLRDMALGLVDAAPIQVAASKTYLAVLKDMEACTRQDQLDGTYSVNDDNANANFTEGLI